MAKRKLSELAVEFVVRCRDDKSATHTWEEITRMVNERFNLDVKWQSVYDRYHSYKKNKVALTTSDNNSSISVERGSEQATVNKPVSPENHPKPQTDLTTLILGTGVREAELEPLSEKTNTDPVVGNSEKNQPKPRLSNNRKFGIGDTPFKHNEVASPELLKLLGIEST